MSICSICFASLPNCKCVLLPAVTRSYTRHSSDEERRVARIEASRKFRDKQRRKVAEASTLEQQMAALTATCQQQAIQINSLQKQLDKV